MLSSEIQSVFQRDILLPSSGLKSSISKKLVGRRQAEKLCRPFCTYSRLVYSVIVKRGATYCSETLVGSHQTIRIIAQKTACFKTFFKSIYFMIVYHY
jgi:hypothetical protein